MIHDEIVTYEVAKLAKEKGFDVYCDYTYYNHYRVRDEIKIKYPDLSDDGYDDLRKIYGGPYYDNELFGYYIEALKLHSKNSTIGINPITKKPCATSAICAAPTQSQLQRWLRRKKGVVVEVFMDDDSNMPLTYNIHQYKDGNWECVCHHHGNYYTVVDWELCLEDAFRYTLKNLI